MKTLHTYLTRQVIASLVMTVVVITFVLLVGNLLRDVLGLLVGGQATLGSVASAIGLLIPWVWVFALPMGMLTATLLVFGRFSADQELTAVRASGIGLFSLITPILLLSLLLCGISAVVNLEIAPRCRVAFNNLRFKIAFELSSAQLPERRFITHFPGFMFYIDRNRKEGLQDVRVFFLEKGIVTKTMHAVRGEVQVVATNRQILVTLFQVSGVDLNNGRSSPFYFSEVPITIPLDPQSKTPKKPSITDLTFKQLQDEMRDLESRMALPVAFQGLTAERLRDQKRELERQRADLLSPLRVQMHRQVAFSFACFGFTLIGIPLGIRLHRRETNVSFFVALALVLLYYSFILIGQSLSTHPEWTPHLIVWLPNFIFQAVGAVLLWRANRGM